MALAGERIGYLALSPRLDELAALRGAGCRGGAWKIVWFFL